MAGAGAEAQQGPEGPQAPGGPEGAALEAWEALRAALEEESTELEAEQEAYDLAERSVRAREASVEAMTTELAEAQQGQEDLQAPGGPEGALEARVATLKAALAGEAAELEAERAALALADRSVRDRAESVEEKVTELAEAQRVLDLHWKVQAARQDPNWRDWAGLPEELLVKVAGTLVAQTEAGWAAQLKKEDYLSEEYIQEEMAQRKQDGNCLFVFAMVCKEWRKAQLKVGGPLRTRVYSDVIRPGQVALVKWALAEGCPREDDDDDMDEIYTMAKAAGDHGHLDLIKWLCGEGGFAMDEMVMQFAAKSGNLELVRWLRGEGCPWDHWTCYYAGKGHVEVLRWARENGCPWQAWVRDRAAEDLGYTDDFGNLVESSDDENSDENYSDEDSDDE